MPRLSIWEFFLSGPYFLSLFFPMVIGYSFFVSLILNIILIFKIKKIGKNR
jgi:hypothetical protein